MRIRLYERNFSSLLKWAHDETDRVDGYLIIELIINLHVLFTFSVSVANKTFNRRNPFAALAAALESESVASGKYDRLKDRITELGLWYKL